MKDINIYLCKTHACVLLYRTQSEPRKIQGSIDVVRASGSAMFYLLSYHMWKRYIPTYIFQNNKISCMWCTLHNTFRTKENPYEHWYSLCLGPCHVLHSLSHTICDTYALHMFYGLSHVSYVKHIVCARDTQAIHRYSRYILSVDTITS